MFFVFSLGFRTLADGIPILVKQVTVSEGSVPTENQHASCGRVVCPLTITCAPRDVCDFRNLTWDRATKGVVDYATEADIVTVVESYLFSIIKAMNLTESVKLFREIGLKSIRADISVLTLFNELIGVVEVKKPSKFDIFSQSTVLGELFDQMMLAEGFYGNGPIMGLLCTGNKYMLAWFPADDRSFEGSDISENAATPERPLVRPSNDSPPGVTPSQMHPKVHCIEDADVFVDEDNSDGTVDRRLYTTKVYDIYEEPVGVLNLVYHAIFMMTQARGRPRSAPSRFLLGFHKEKEPITWHPMPENIMLEVNFSKFPHGTVKNLFAIEDLGRGAAGRAWLTVTQRSSSSSSNSSSNSTSRAVCVLKFSNRGESHGLKDEAACWRKVYPEFATRVSLESWSGFPALKMPHFADISVDERIEFIQQLMPLLTRFENAGLVHKDVKWKNMGKYQVRDSGDICLVLYDFSHIGPFHAVNDAGWKERAVEFLTRELSPTSSTFMGMDIPALQQNFEDSLNLSSATATSSKAAAK